MGLIASTTAPRPPSVEAWQFAGLWDFSRWAVRRNDASETPVGDRKVAAPSYLQFPISQNPPQEDFSSWHFPVCQLPASWVKHDTTPGHQGAPGSLGKLQQPWMRTHRRPKTRWLPAASEKSGCKQETVEGPPLPSSCPDSGAAELICSDTFRVKRFRVDHMLYMSLAFSLCINKNDTITTPPLAQREDVIEGTDLQTLQKTCTWWFSR